MMRFGLCALALIGIAACSPGKIEVKTETGEAVVVAGRGDYTLQVVGDDGAQVYLVTAPDGRTAAAKVEGGVSSLLGPADAQNIVSSQKAALAETAPTGEDVSIRLPGFSLDVSENGTDGDRGRVKMRAMGIDLDVDADEGAAGDRAVVRIGGVDEQAVRDFIEGADGLSPETRAEMLKKLGL